MITFSKSILLSGLICGLGACSYGGGGGSDGADDPVAAGDVAPQNPFTSGTESTDQGGNGLGFAAAHSALTDTNGQTLSVRMVRHITDAQTGEVRLEVTTETINMEDIDDETLTATIGGETVAFVDGDGERLDGSNLSVDNFFEGDFSTVRSLFGYPEEGEQTEAVFVVGLETNPEVIQALTGQVTYSGDISGFGTEVTNGGESFVSEAFFSGDVEIIADFASEQISGTTNVTLDESGLDFDFDVVDAQIIGNGFGTELELVSCSDGLTCTSNSNIGGAFHGPNGEELAGIAGLDLSTTDADGNTLDYIASGGFIANEGGTIGGEAD